MAATRLADQLLRIKFHRVGVLVVDGPPQRLERLFVEALVERVFRGFGPVAVRDHAGEYAFVEHALYEPVNILRHGLQCLGQRRERVRGEVLTVGRRDGIVVGDVVVFHQIAVDLPRLRLGELDGARPSTCTVLPVKYSRLARVGAVV